jgi:hypothetical protein
LAIGLRRKEPWCPNLSLFARKLTIFGYWRILLQKSAVTDDVIQRIHLGDGVLSRDPDARYAIPLGGIAVWSNIAVFVLPNGRFAPKAALGRLEIQLPLYPPKADSTRKS